MYSTQKTAASRDGIGRSRYIADNVLIFSENLDKLNRKKKLLDVIENSLPTAMVPIQGSGTLALNYRMRYGCKIYRIIYLIPFNILNYIRLDIFILYS